MQEKKRQLARILFDMNVKMFLRDNYVHGDMHAGNLIFSMEDGRVTVIDAGLITSLKPDIANSFGDFLRALCSSDVDTIVEKLLQFNIGRVSQSLTHSLRRTPNLQAHTRTHTRAAHPTSCVPRILQTAVMQASRWLMSPLPTHPSTDNQHRDHNLKL
jgi:serine/threonine-protein kinase RIO1